MFVTCDDCGSEWNTTLGESACPNPRCPARIMDDLAELAKARDQWRKDAVACQSIATSLDVHLGVARRSIAEQDEQIATLKAEVAELTGREFATREQSKKLAGVLEQVLLWRDLTQPNAAQWADFMTAFETALAAYRKAAPK